MNFSKKTYCTLGVVSAALNILGGAGLIFGARYMLLFNLATVAAGAMMLLLAMCAGEDKESRSFCLAGVMLTALGMIPGAIGAVCGAASWPVFAWPYFRQKSAADAGGEPLHKSAFLVILCGGVLLLGSFLPIPQMLGACIIIAVAVVQGLFAWLLRMAADQM